jgi:F0F1-type ATP synthase membrane subunit b/b'
MKEILRRLLEAEEAGRCAAAELQAAGDELVRRARSECEAIVNRARTNTAREIEELERRMQSEIEAGRQAIVNEAEQAARQLRAQAGQRRHEAVRRVVAMLLGEPNALFDYPLRITRSCTSGWAR